MSKRPTEVRSINEIRKAADAGQLITKKEVAAFLQLSTRTIENYMLAGLPTLHINSQITRFYLNKVIRWVEENHLVVCANVKSAQQGNLHLPVHLR